jgi:HAD superfamily hydrolase (TIGR01662 family)
MLVVDMSADRIPYAHLQTIFLDVGNTLVSMDYRWIRDELAERGHRFSLEAVQRAEASARPAVSRSINGSTSTEGLQTFTFYIGTMIGALAHGMDAREVAILAKELVRVFQGSDHERLWSYVLPGVPEALSELRSMGLRLVVVSNSNGTVENLLERCGLREKLDAVFDSFLVGFEKPDARLFEHALERTGALPARTLHIGDIYSADVVGARRAGLHAALVDPYGDWPDVDCPRFESLEVFCETLGKHRPA